MYVNKLTLNNFRNLKNINLEFNKNLNIFTGLNAQGKTNVIESIYVSLNGRSPRDNNSVHFVGPYSSSAKIHLQVNCNEVIDEIEILFGEKRKFVRNGVVIGARSELLKNYSTIFFGPDDLRLVKDGPYSRRVFINDSINSLTHLYDEKLSEYNKILKQRNQLLKFYRASDEFLLEVYDEQLSQVGSEIIKYRVRFLHQIESYIKRNYATISENVDDISMRYISNVIASNDLRNIVDEYKEKLIKSREQDLKYKTSVVGIHRDDIGIYISGREASKFASQGQQRSIVLSMKLALIDMCRDKSDYTPVVFLDDVMSELDEIRRGNILGMLSGVQTFITTTELIDNVKYDYSHFTVEKGIIEMQKMELKGK